MLPFYNAHLEIFILRNSELGTLANKKNATLIVLAHYNKDSRKIKGKRRIRGGRSLIRTVLYMAMLSAIQHNSVMKVFYSKLVTQGKHKKVAITARIAKIISIHNPMIGDNSYWKFAKLILPQP